MSHSRFSCRKGLKPESPNQDSFCVLINEDDFVFYGVFDGHGGKEVAEYAKDNFKKKFIKSKPFREGNF